MLQVLKVLCIRGLMTEERARYFSIFIFRVSSLCERRIRRRSCRISPLLVSSPHNVDADGYARDFCVRRGSAHHFRSSFLAARRFLRALVCHFLSKVHRFPDHRTWTIKNVRKRGERRETGAGRRCRRNTLKRNETLERALLMSSVDGRRQGWWLVEGVILRAA